MKLFYSNQHNQWTEDKKVHGNGGIFLNDTQVAEFAKANGFASVDELMKTHPSSFFQLNESLKIEKTLRLCSDCPNDKTPMKKCQVCQEFYCPIWGSECKKGATHNPWTDAEKTYFVVHQRSSEDLFQG